MRSARLALVLVSCCFLTACSREGTPRFHYVPAPPPVPAGRTDGFSLEEEEVEKLLQRFVEAPVAVDYFRNVLKTAVLVIQDFDDLTFTVHIDGAAARIARGTEAGLVPDYVIPLWKRNCENLVKMVEDGKIDAEEAYRIHVVTFVPVLRSIFQLPPLYNEWVAKQLALPSLIHMTLRNERGYRYNNTTREMSATVANVEGQWIVFEGLQGSPGMKTSATVEQVVALTALLKKPMDPNDVGAAKARIQEVKGFLQSISVPIPGRP